MSLIDFTPRPLPERKNLEGRFVCLEPLSAQRHLEGLFFASHQPDGDTRFQWLFENAPKTKEELRNWMEKVETLNDPMFFVVIDRQNGAIDGRQALMRIDTTNGVIEIGHIYWGPHMQRSRKATEAFFLFATYVFDALGYRRLEWKCNNENAPSKKAAKRFGFTFEGLFRQHMIQKGKNRDTAWFSILDEEWKWLKQAYQDWLQPDNFDEYGKQKQTLSDFIERHKTKTDSVY